MKIHLKLFSTFFFLVTSVTQITAQEATEAHKDSLNAVIEMYYDLNVNVFQSNSTIKDIDKIFDLFTEGFTYVHPKYGGTYTRKDLYNGYVRNQKNGGYNGSVVDIKVVNKIVGLNAVVVQKKFVKKDQQEKEKLEMTLFEFNNGKISRIFEYW